MRKISKKLTLLLFGLGLGLLLLLSAGAFYFFHTHASIHTKNKNPSADPLPTVTVLSLKSQIIPLTISTYGQVVSNTSVILMAQSSGVISKINFQPGQAVKKNDVLFTLDSNDTGAQLDELAAELSINQERYNRNVELQKLSADAISEIDLLQSKATYEQSLAEYQEAKTIHTIVSPIDGIISDTNLSIGDFVNTGDVLAQIISPEHLQIKYQIPSTYLNQIKLNQTIIFYPESSGTAYSGMVAYISPLLSANDYEINVRADLISNPRSPLLLNTFGQIIQTVDPNHPVIAVPQNLVQTDSQGFYVNLATKNIHQTYSVTKQYFIPGQITASGLIEAKSGLELGMNLITSNPASLTPGEIIQINHSDNSNNSKETQAS